MVLVWRRCDNFGQFLAPSGAEITTYFGAGDIYGDGF